MHARALICWHSRAATSAAAVFTPKASTCSVLPGLVVASHITAPTSENRTRLVCQVAHSGGACSLRKSTYERCHLPSSIFVSLVFDWGARRHNEVRLSGGITGNPATDGFGNSTPCPSWKLQSVTSDNMFRRRRRREKEMGRTHDTQSSAVLGRLL